MATTEPHEMMTCPYNKSHQIERYRLQFHLEKCRKQYPNCNKLSCPFDATHVVNDVELDYHVSVCPQRHLFDTMVYVTEDDSTPIETLRPPPIKSDENWDDDDGQSFKPNPEKAGNHILKKAKGLTPSERRKVRMEGVRTYKAPPEEEQ